MEIAKADDKSINILDRFCIVLFTHTHTHTS